MIGVLRRRKRFEHPLLRRLGIELKRLHRGLAPQHVIEGGALLKRYSVGLATVYVYEYEGRGYYVVEEPELSEVEQEAYYQALELLYFSAKFRPESDPREAIESALHVLSKRFGKSINIENLRYYLYRDALGYRVLDVIMRDPLIEDISVEGVDRPVRVFHRDFSYLDWLVTNIVFRDESELDSIAALLAHKARRHISTAFPIVEGTLPEKHRLALTYSYEVSPFGTGFTIRKFREEPLTIAQDRKSVV